MGEAAALGPLAAAGEIAVDLNPRIISHVASATSLTPIGRFNAIAGGTQKRHQLHGASPGAPPAGLLIRRGKTCDVRTWCR
jgi:hypothetical protein